MTIRNEHVLLTAKKLDTVCGKSVNPGHTELASVLRLCNNSTPDVFIASKPRPPQELLHGGNHENRWRQKCELYEMVHTSFCGKFGVC